jgi:Holliday junction resolvasome RuvABC ATP-dependent DNA helicase subunit
MNGMGIEEQIKDIARNELEMQLSVLEERLQAIFSSELESVKIQLEEINSQLVDLKGRVEKLEEDLSNRWGLLVKLRKYTLDQLMTEYKRLTGSLRPEKEDTVENADT